MTFTIEDTTLTAPELDRPEHAQRVLVDGLVRHPAGEGSNANDLRLADLSRLAHADIETSMSDSLSDDLHSLFDVVSDGVLPIYFGPLLGRLFLEGL